ncbi:hypothetical protein BDZ45DRAFT_755822 [Acephala macrosclerotiorum]|nr:hypothetical protein BDZ45DRAFT_755822 [Acephala macrosclerotiorum]
MAVPFGFSVCDIIAGIGVIKTAMGALRSTGGAAVQYQSLLTSLDILSDCFADIEETYADQTGDDRRHLAIFREIVRCKLCIDRFHQRFTKYEVLKANEHALEWRQQLRRSMKKVQWAVFDKGEIERFNQELHERIDSVKFLLLSFQVHRAEIERKAQQMYRERMLGTEQLLSDISTSNQDYFEQQKIWIDEIKMSQDVLLQTSGSQAVQTQDMLRMLQEMHQRLSNSCLSLEHVSLVIDPKQLFEKSHELHRQRDREYSRRFEMLLEKIQIQATVPPQVLFQAPVTFLDALGRLAPIQLDFITSAEAFIAVIKIRFRNIGLKKIEQEEYLLSDPHRKRKLDLKLPWETVMTPGQRVEMSMIFSKEEMQTTCPTCRKENVGPKDSEIAW